MLNSIKTARKTTNLSLRITVPRVSKLRFMWQPSFSLVPADNDWDARSLPAKSTKFYVQMIKQSAVTSVHYYMNTLYCSAWEKHFRTTVAKRVLKSLSLPMFSPAELSIVCNNLYVKNRVVLKFNRLLDKKSQLFYQSDDLVRSRACFVQGSLPNLSLSCNI